MLVSNRKTIAVWRKVVICIAVSLNCRPQSCNARAEWKFRDSRLRGTRASRYRTGEGTPMIRIILAAALALATQAAAAQVPPEALKELAPTGKLRAAINYGNGVLAQKGPDGEPRGVSAELLRELAKRLGVPLEYVTFTAAGKAFKAAKENKVDVLFVAIEPVRAAEVEVSPPYVLIDGAYLVLNDSTAPEPTDLDQLSIHIALPATAAALSCRG